MRPKALLLLLLCLLGCGDPLEETTANGTDVFLPPAYGKYESGPKTIESPELPGMKLFFHEPNLKESTTDYLERKKALQDRYSPASARLHYHLNQDPAFKDVVERATVFNKNAFDYYLSVSYPFVPAGEIHFFNCSSGSLYLYATDDFTLQCNIGKSAVFLHLLIQPNTTDIHPRIIEWAARQKTLSDNYDSFENYTLHLSAQGKFYHSKRVAYKDEGTYVDDVFGRGLVPYLFLEINTIPKPRVLGE